MVGCSIQNICAITTQIESSICKFVEQKAIYVTKMLCIISVCNHTLFEETVLIKFYTDIVVFAYTYVDHLAVGALPCNCHVNYVALKHV